MNSLQTAGSIPSVVVVLKVTLMSPRGLGAAAAEVCCVRVIHVQHLPTFNGRTRWGASAWRRSASALELPLLEKRIAQVESSWSAAVVRTSLEVPNSAPVLLDNELVEGLTVDEVVRGGKTFWLVGGILVSLGIILTSIGRVFVSSMTDTFQYCGRGGECPPIRTRRWIRNRFSVRSETLVSHPFPPKKNDVLCM
jgi:hypothetical protein